MRSLDTEEADLYQMLWLELQVRLHLEIIFHSACKAKISGHDLIVMHPCPAHTASDGALEGSSRWNCRLCKDGPRVHGKHFVKISME